MKKSVAALFSHFVRRCCVVQVRLARPLVILLLSITWSSATEPLRLAIKLSVNATELEWTQTPATQVSGFTLPNLTHDYLIQKSSDFWNWGTIGSVRENLNAAGGKQALFLSDAARDSHAFFRVLKVVSLTGANLSGANLPKINLTAANLSGTKFDKANLREARLASANLRSADFSDADLSYADLRSADLSDAKIEDAILLNTTMPDGRVLTDDSDAEILALRISGGLLPPDQLYQRIRNHLRTIRRAFPIVKDLHIYDDLGIGRLMTVQATAQQIEAIGNSEFGPVRSQGFSFGLTSLAFAKRFNPEVLAAILISRFGVALADASTKVGDGDRIEFDLAKSEYTFSRGFGDCPSGCDLRQSWVFSINANGIATLLKEYGPGSP